MQTKTLSVTVFNYFVTGFSLGGLRTGAFKHFKLILLIVMVSHNNIAVALEDAMQRLLRAGALFIYLSMFTDLNKLLSLTIKIILQMKIMMNINNSKNNKLQEEIYTNGSVSVLLRLAQALLRSRLR